MLDIYKGVKYNVNKLVAYMGAKSGREGWRY